MIRYVLFATAALGLCLSPVAGATVKTTVRSTSR